MVRGRRVTCSVGLTSESGAWQQNLMERGRKGCPLTKPLWGQKTDSGGCTLSGTIYGHFPLWKTLWKLMELFTVAVLFCAVRDRGQTWVGSVFRVWKGVSMLLTTVLLMYIYTACWLNNYVVQLCPFWCNSYGAWLSRLLTRWSD